MSGQNPHTLGPSFPTSAWEPEKSTWEPGQASYTPVRYITYTADMPASASATASTAGRRRKGEMSKPSTRAAFSTMAMISVGTRTSAWKAVPAVGMAIYATNAKRVTDEMFIEAAHAVA